jgi:molybdopterin converting factor small subunit
MTVHIILFGQLADIIGVDKITVENSLDTDSMVKSLQNTYPALSQSTFIIAVDKKIISSNTLLTDQCTVALLPPFSGG